MTACIIGTVTAIKDKLVTIEDRLTKQQYDCETESDEFFNLKEGDQGVFVGQYLENIFRVKRVEVRKFLDPLYEADLYDVSGKFTLIPVLNDPFTATYLEFMEKQKEIDEQETRPELDETGSGMS